MASPINKGTLKKITNAPSSVDSVAEILNALVENQTISVDVGSLVKHALEASRAEFEAAIDARPEELAKAEAVKVEAK